ncbi:MAG: 16S rRNA (uracil(1498)-N(3))-methyltransferase [Proteobacteria bacterium]|nr:16S rRNA (uracil(1498)-N(3))-methyltransferase [Pseudomonadota bacterium]MBU1715212.1 16S rRNA (uracil(1498)-N(3))-methyltransferase [Pseudomonadota bacterium]
MNIILLEEQEIKNNRVSLTDRRQDHILKILRAKKDDLLKIGLINGPLGIGRITAIDKKEVVLDLELAAIPPEPPPLDLILALPRPIMLKRVLTQAASMGVSRIFLINANRVEKSYFTSSLLTEQNIRQRLLLGLEQAAMDTRVPEISIHKRFRPFIEDYLPANTSPDDPKLIAHPGTEKQLHQQMTNRTEARVILAIGPEGGWVDFEIDNFRQQGFKTFTLGPRILRVDTAVPALLSQITLLRNMA